MPAICFRVGLCCKLPEPASMATALPGRSSKTWLAVIAGGLLSSNCCALQLLLNFMGAGCAGFAILSPYRLYFLAASLSFFMIRTPHSYSNAIVRSSQAVIFCALVSMPEIISLYSRHAAYYSSASEINLPSSLLFLRIFGMKCAACGERARALSLTLPCVRDSSVHWERGHMKLQVVSGFDIAECGRGVSAVLQRAHFEIVSFEQCAGSSTNAAEHALDDLLITIISNQKHALPTGLATPSGNCSLFT